MNMIPIENVVVGKRLRQVRPEAVEALAQSIREVGLLNPVLVIPLPENEGMFRLVAGNHRLEACKRLGMREIAANILTSLEVDQRLAEIDENLCRADLTHLEMAEHLAERKSLYEMKYPETRHGGTPGMPGGGKKPKDAGIASFAQDTTAGMPGGGKKPKDAGIASFAQNTVADMPDEGKKPKDAGMASFAQDTAEKTGKAERTIQQAVRRATNISQEVRDTIRTVEAIADNSLELDALANLEESEQKAAVQAVLDGKARSVREVVRQKEGTPHPPTTHPAREEQNSNAENDDTELQEWKRQAKEASSEVMAAKGNIRTLKRQLAELKTRIKELESVPPTPVVPSADIETWKTRALASEEECIYIRHQMDEMAMAAEAQHTNRGSMLMSLLGELEEGLNAEPGSFKLDTLEWFEDRFMNLMFLIKSIKRRTN